MNYPYETLSYVGRLQFLDARGIDARFHYYQRIRVLAPVLFCLPQWVWGDGDQVLDYAAVGAELTAHRRDGGRDVLVSLVDNSARRGDELTLHAIRRIHHAFKDAREWWEYTPFTPTEQARVSISFPIAKEPEAISVSASPGSRTPYVRRPATEELILSVASPTIGAVYRAEWSW